MVAGGRVSIDPTSRGDRRPVIGLTGGIGAGKSTVARILESLGCVVSDSDADAAAILEEPETIGTIREWWGDQVVREDGSLDRAAIAARIFEDEAARGRLEQLVHPRIHDRRRARFAAAGPEARAFVIDAPLLFEAGLDQECDSVLFVDAPRDVRLARVAEARGWSEEELLRREAAQLPLEEKLDRATSTVPNGETTDRLEAEIRGFLDSIAPTRTGEGRE